MARYSTLGDKECEVLPMVIELLREHIGRDKAITNTQLRAQLIEIGYQDIGQIRMRKLINYIRNNSILICLKGCTYGYYITEDPEEIRAYISSLVKREGAIRHTRETIENQLEMLLN